MPAHVGNVVPEYIHTCKLQYNQRFGRAYNRLLARLIVIPRVAQPDLTVSRVQKPDIIWKGSLFRGLLYGSLPVVVGVRAC